MRNYPTVLTIAGSDSSGGAGIQADIKSISANGGYAASVITCITAQNTQGVQAIEALSPDMVDKQLQSVCEDLQIDAVKIGVLPTPDVISAVLDAIKKYQLKNIIIDPVMIAQSGDALVDASIADLLPYELFQMGTLLTPNIPEADMLCFDPGTKNKQHWTPGQARNDNTSATPSRTQNLSSRTPIRDPEKQKKTKKLSEKFQCNILLKGGHDNDEHCQDILYIKHKNAFYTFNSKKIITKNTHGTGCSLSSAIATFVARDFDLIEAVRQAHEYIYQAIKHGAHYQIGQGNGPICHFYNQSKVVDDVIKLRD